VSIQNTFLELKDAYLELEAKQGFLEHLAREDVLSMEESQIQNAMETLGMRSPLCCRGIE